MYMVNLVQNHTLDLRKKIERTLDLVKNFKRTLDLRGEGGDTLTSFNVDSKMAKCGHLILLNISYM